MASDLKPAKCRSCLADVYFVPSVTTGKLMILDAQPNPKGNVVIRDGKAAVIEHGLWGTPTEEQRFMDHHATCPDAAKYRRKK